MPLVTAPINAMSSSAGNICKRIYFSCFLTKCSFLSLLFICMFSYFWFMMMNIWWLTCSLACHSCQWTREEFYAMFLFFQQIINNQPLLTVKGKQHNCQVLSALNRWTIDCHSSNESNFSLTENTLISSSTEKIVHLAQLPQMCKISRTGYNGISRVRIVL